MEQKIYDEYVRILQEELVPAMGCTEPIAIAYGAAVAARALGTEPESVEVRASANIIKNVKSVVVPCTGGQRGISAAVCAGIVAADTEKGLEILASMTEEQKEQAKKLQSCLPVSVNESRSGYIFDIQIKASAGGHSGYAQIAGYHTNVICVKKDEKVMQEKPYVEQKQSFGTDRELLTVERIADFAECVEISHVEEVLERQIAYNTAIAQEGMRGSFGAQIGKILLECYGDNVQNRAKAIAAAGSDARMNGCELPVIINSGSGNQGIASSVPVIVYAREKNIPTVKLYRALIFSSLLTIYQKEFICFLRCGVGLLRVGGSYYLYGGREYRPDQGNHRQYAGEYSGHYLRRRQDFLRGQDCVEH